MQAYMSCKTKCALLTVVAQDACKVEKGSPRRLFIRRVWRCLGNIQYPCACYWSYCEMSQFTISTCAGFQGLPSCPSQMCSTISSDQQWSSGSSQALHSPNGQGNGHLNHLRSPEHLLTAATTGSATCASGNPRHRIHKPRINEVYSSSEYYVLLQCCMSNFFYLRI